MPSNLVRSHRMLLRVLLPSTTSVVLCLLGATVVVIGGLLVDSVSYGTVLPGFFGSEFATLYTNTVVRQVEVVLHSVLLNGVVPILLLSVAGAIFYGFLKLFIHAKPNWRAFKEDVQFVNRWTVLRHPLRYSFIMLLLWRITIIVLAVVLILITHPLTSDVLAVTHKAIISKSTSSLIHETGVAILAWSILIYCGVVLLRLYMLRTRLFGDDIIYTM